MKAHYPGCKLGDQCNCADQDDEKPCPHCEHPGPAIFQNGQWSCPECFYFLDQGETVAAEKHVCGFCKTPMTPGKNSVGGIYHFCLTSHLHNVAITKLPDDDEPKDLPQTLWWPLWKHMHDAHGLILVDDECNQIARAADEARQAASNNGWTQTPPTEGGLYWLWGGGPDDSPPFPVTVMKGGWPEKCWLAPGQWGWNWAQDLDEHYAGAWWKPCVTPALPVEAENLFTLVPLYDETESQFFNGQKYANDDFVSGRQYDQDMRFMNPDVQSGYAHEWNRLTQIRSCLMETEASHE